MQQEAKFGSYVVIPLKYDAGQFNEKLIGERFIPTAVDTLDVNENVRELFDRAKHQIGACYRIPAAQLCEAFGGIRSFTVTREKCHAFRVEDSYLYVFHTQIAFLCLQVRYEHMDAIQCISNLGFAQSRSSFCCPECGGKVFTLETWLDGILHPIGLRKFFDGEASYVLDAYTYLLAVMPERFATLDEMKHITFNLHQMVPPDSCIEDDSEQDIRYVYAVKTPSLGTYRWGCCIASQTISYVYADPAMDLDEEMETQAKDGLPIVVLALYEKYTCLRFAQLIRALDQKTMKQIKDLKQLMLEFQAFGTITPANLSRWHNVKQIYADILEVNEIEQAVKDVEIKLDILAAQQEELERSRSETIINLITVFGIISILASVLDIIQILSGGDALIWVSMIVTNIALVLSMWLAMRTRK